MAVLLTQTAYGQVEKVDSISSLATYADSSFLVEYHNRKSQQYGKFAIFTKKQVEKPVYQILHVSVPLFVAGGIAFAFDDDFKAMRGSYAPGFRHSYDDYLQYAPAAIMLAMKAAGVEGRSSWGRMLVSDAFSVGTMVLLVNGLKYSVQRERPDGSANNSFPSGHTATAFMTATMFHKEYGLTRSPLYSVLGYSLATATAVSRQLNNRHWVSDVLVGAGIGILSVELGYYFADLIFKEKGLKREVKRSFDDAYFGNPNFMGIEAGYTFLNQSVNFMNGISLQSKGGVTASLEGAWFFNRYFGIGAKASALNSPIFVNITNLHSGAQQSTSRGQSMKMISVSPGLYLSYPLAYGILVGARVTPSVNFTDKISVDEIASTGKPITVAYIGESISAGLQTGVSITKMTSSNFGLSLNINYSAYFVNLKGGGVLHNEMRQLSDRRTINTIAISATASAYLFKNRKK